MADVRSAQLEDMLRRIDAALASRPALSGERVADVRRLQAELVDLYEAGRIEEARRCEMLALALVEDAPQNPGGPAGPELCFVPQVAPGRVECPVSPVARLTRSDCDALMEN